MSRPNIIAGSRSWCISLAEKLEKSTGTSFLLIQTSQELTLDSVREINPRYIFFPHWSWIISEDIWQEYECIIFHMTDLPFGRGGSPLQNLIVRGFKETKITALRCDAGLDTGPIYLKRPLSLLGTAEEIFIRANDIVGEMIEEFFKNDLQPQPQQGEIVCFKRRTPEESNLADTKSLTELFDRIRMMDAEGYPPAYFDIGDFRLEFSRATLKTQKLISDVSITLREKS